MSDSHDESAYYDDAPPPRKTPFLLWLLLLVPRFIVWQIRSLNRHKLFFLHALAFIIGGALIWTLYFPTPMRQMYTLGWLALWAAHGMLIYRQKLVAFAFHLLMFSAGNAAIWSSAYDSTTKIAINAAWLVIVLLIGVVMFRSYVLRRVSSPDTPAPKRQRKAAAR